MEEYWQPLVPITPGVVLLVLLIMRLVVRFCLRLVYNIIQVDLNILIDRTIVWSVGFCGLVFIIKVSWGISGSLSNVFFSSPSLST